MMEYRVDFLIGILSVALQQFAGVFFLSVVFGHIQNLNGWTFYELLFIYAIAACGRSIHHIFFDNLWTLGWQYIKPGQLDRLLIRPINPFFHVCADRLQQDGFGQLLIGSVILWTSVSHLDLTWGAGEILMLLLLIFSSGVLFVAINLFFAALSFWMTDSMPVLWAVFNLSEFARFPLTIYHKGLQFFLTWIIPYGFTAFLPAAWFLDREGYAYVAAAAPITAAAAMALAYSVWLLGLKNYSSTGS
ncbi:ABC transporter permease [Bacillus mangrovi]|uniref:ABC transporter permease n=2 Tax=Metabacillus mangrovi TaxID=1491830 RepID=A0A7X2V3H8_9BACI|nr:ABC transporter permease [Metabacillus mangrovi]